jgi:hypothetical protein
MRGGTEAESGGEGEGGGGRSLAGGGGQETHGFDFPVQGHDFRRLETTGGVLQKIV